jgi:serine protease AprX
LSAAVLPAARRVPHLAVLAVAATLLLAAQAAAPVAPAPLSPALERLAADRPSGLVEVIVRAQDPAAARAAVRAAGGTTTRELPIARAVVARLQAGRAEVLARTPGVVGVSLNAAVAQEGTIDPDALRTSFNQSVRADRAWGIGATGKGVGVAVVDTGIQGDLPDFRRSADDRTSRVVATAVVHPGADDAGDTYGHGTHVAGIIAGNGAARDADDPLRGLYAGVAPEAHLIAVKVDDGRGEATVADVIDGLQFVVDHRHELGIRVVNLSLRSAEAQPARLDPLNAAVEQAWFSGLVVVAAAGNGGTEPDAVSYAPGNDPFVITVGGVDDKGTKTIRDDELAPWSSRGRTQEGVEKPDVVAPGARIASTVPPGSYYATACPECVVDGEYLRVGGTSMAAGVVSGEVALLLEEQPWLTPDQVKATIVRRTRAVVEPVAGAPVDALGQPLPPGVTPATVVTGGEAAADKALRNPVWRPANEGLEPSALLDPLTRTIDLTRAGWSRAGWSRSDALRAGWSQETWVPSTWVRAGWSATPGGCADLERAGWSRAGWSSEELAAAEAECVAMDPVRAGWSRAGWSRAGWSTSFDR